MGMGCLQSNNGMFVKTISTSKSAIRRKGDTTARMFNVHLIRGQEAKCNSTSNDRIRNVDCCVSEATFTHVDTAVSF